MNWDEVGYKCQSYQFDSIFLVIEPLEKRSKAIVCNKNQSAFHLTQHNMTFYRCLLNPFSRSLKNIVCTALILCRKKIP